MRVALALLIVSASLVGCTSGSSTAVCLPDEASVARVWNEAALDAVRRDFPAPTVTARNLFHLSVAMWNTWAAFEPDATAILVDPEADPASAAPPDDVDRESAIAFAAHTVLTDRYGIAIGADESLAQFDELLTTLCLDPAEPEPFGEAMGQAVLAATAEDGSRQDDFYVAPFVVVNEPMAIDEPGTVMVDPNRWQQLQFQVAMTQNGQLLESNVQDYIGPHWGSVTPFALEADPDGLPIDPGPPPLFGTNSDEEFRLAAREVVRASSRLDPGDGQLLDISPGARGNNPLGTNDGEGHEVNPATGQSYEPNEVPAADYYRVIAEFWADGPDSETPPGHWNTLANGVTDALVEAGDGFRVGGTGDEVDRLQWEVSLYVALNAALHDAAIAAWGAKAHYDYSRPVSMIRYLGGLGLLPEEPGLVETITEASSGPGERHEDLADHVGETAILAWAEKPVFFGERFEPVRWIRAVEWLPYQRRTFVTPAFPGYVSGHSTFSRAAAEVLAAITGSDFFPGGLAIYTVDELEFDDGPASPVELQWATYDDAADEAGISRIYGGIHVAVDDVAGRVMGAEVGQAAWAEVQQYFPNSGE